MKKCALSVRQYIYEDILEKHYRRTDRITDSVTLYMHMPVHHIAAFFIQRSLVLLVLPFLGHLLLSEVFIWRKINKSMLGSGDI